MSSQPEDSSTEPTTSQDPSSSRPAPATATGAPLTWSSPESTTPTSNPASPPAGGSDADPSSTGSSAPQLAPQSTPNGSSPESSTGSVSARKHLEEVLSTVIDAATTFAHQFATDEIGKEVGLWLADEQDKAGIAQPGAKMLSRRGVLDGATSDVSDGIQLLIAVGGYVSKQLTRFAAVRRARKAYAAMPGQPVEHDPAPAA